MASGLGVRSQKEGSVRARLEGSSSAFLRPPSDPVRKKPLPPSNKPQIPAILRQTAPRADLRVAGCFASNPGAAHRGTRQRTGKPATERETGSAPGNPAAARKTPISGRPRPPRASPLPSRASAVLPDPRFRLALQRRKV